MKTTRYLFFHLSWLLVFTLMLPSFAQIASSKNTIEGNSSQKTRTLKLVLKEIEEKFHIYLNYESGLLAGKSVNANFQINNNLSESLNDLLSPFQLDFRKVGDNFYIIHPKKIERQLSLQTENVTPKTNDAYLSLLSNTTIALQTPFANLLPVVFKITGKVTDENGVGLAGVSILLKGTGTGTITDLDGKYAISIPDEIKSSGVLIFSFIGYTTEERAINNQAIINLSFTPDVRALQQVVVTGYGTQNKREVTGSISQVKSEELVQFQAPTLDAMLQGRGTGIQVNQASGTPGGPVRVMVRGTGSISSGAEPLWVLDGIPIFDGSPSGVGSSRNIIPQNPLATINPNDIESIEVLKDAAATAIYGSRGANGVILVTTKTGKKGKGGLNIDYTSGVQSLTRTASDMGFVNTQQWLSLLDQSRVNSGLPVATDINPLLSQINTNIDPNSRIDRNSLANTNWFNEILRTGAFREANVSISRAFDKGSMFVSGNWRKDDGVLKGNDFTRASARANIEFQPINHLTTGVRFTLAYSENNRIPASGIGTPCCNDNVANGGFGVANNTLPIFPISLASGAYWNPKSGANPVAASQREYYLNRFRNYRVLGGGYLDYQVPFLKGLSLRTEFSADINQDHTNFWAGAFLRPSNIPYAEDTQATRRNFNYNAFGTYTKSFGEHSINAVVGTESQRFNTQSLFVRGEDLPGVAPQIGSPRTILSASGGFGGERYIRSYFGRVNYNFKEKYLAGLSFRRDATSIFAQEYRWGNFPALSAGWIMSEENFLKNNKNVSLLKLRASYGVTGNQNIPLATETTFLDWPAYANTTNGLIVSNIGVRELKWETTNAYDFAADYGFLNNRITGSLGYYMRDVRDLLLTTPTPPSAGLQFQGNSIWANIGDMKTFGWEFEINTINIDKGGFKWTTNFNFTTNDNKITALNPSLDARGQGINAGLTRNIAGYRLGTFWVAEFAGINSENGIPMIYEIDRDLFGRTGETVKTGNMIPATTANIANHRIVQQNKTGLPRWYGGFTNNFSYKGIELTAQFTFQGGNYIYDFGEQGWTQPGGLGLARTNIIDNTWTPENRNAEYPRLMWNNRFNIDNAGLPRLLPNGQPNNDQNYTQQSIDRYLFKGDFVRLRTLQIAYNLPKNVVQKLKMQNIRIFISGNNLLTFTGYKGWDPEQLIFDGGAQSRNLQQGAVSPMLPQLRTWSFGLNIGF